MDGGQDRSMSAVCWGEIVDLPLRSEVGLVGFAAMMGARGVEGGVTM